MPQLALMTWIEVEARLNSGACIMVPLGSTEQHGPMGLIGTDTICATEVATAAAERCDAVVAPALGYTPAPFNTSFPGTVSLSVDTFRSCLQEVCDGLLAQGFRGIFLVNGHGANLAPARTVMDALPSGAVQLQSWWEPAEIDALRKEMFGDWEGMHATPSEVAVTQALHGSKPPGAAEQPPEKLSQDFIAAHAGDAHGPPDAHRARFPDGRVGSHSALATPELGAEILRCASDALCRDYLAFCQSLGVTS